jgi:hypothetical protein
MKLLLQRGERPGASPTFTLYARAELLVEEEALIRKYRLGAALLHRGDRHEALSISFGFAVLAFVLSALVAALLGLDFFSSAVLASLCAGISFLIFYERFRDDIYIDEILKGKTFASPSVVDLIEKENLIEDVCLDFQQLLEDMKSWEGEDVVEIAASRAQPRGQ